LLIVRNHLKSFIFYCDSLNNLILRGIWQRLHCTGVHDGLGVLKGRWEVMHSIQFSEPLKNW